MKLRDSFPPSLAATGTVLSLALAVFTLVNVSQAAPITKAATGTDLTAGASWTGSTTPGSSDVATWASTSLGENLTLGTSSSWSNINVTGALSSIGVTGAGTLTLGASGITLGTAAANVTLATPIALGASQTWDVASGRFLIASGIISGTSTNLTKATAGTLTLSGANTFTGTVTITAGTLIATTLADGSSASSIGQSTNAAANLVLSGGTLRYTGPAVSTNRGFTLNASSTINSSTGALNLTNTATPGYGTANAARTLTLAGGSPTANTLAATLTNNGTGAITVIKSGGGIWTLSGSNSYTGTTTISAIVSTNGGLAYGGTLVATTLADGGSPSSIGQSTNAATNLVLGNGTILKYTGGAASTNRSFTINGDSNNIIGATLDASGTGAINFTNTATPGYGTAAFTRTLSLGGSSTATNTLSALLANNTTAAFSLIKFGIGTWSLNGTAVNSYTGSTTVNGGILQEDLSNLATPTNLINSASALTLGGGTLAMKGKDSSPSSQTFGNPTFSASGAGSGISVTGGSSSTMNLTLGNTWTRSAGSTVNVTLGTGGTLTSSPTAANTLVVGSANIAFATFAGTDWAKVSGGTVVGFAPADYTGTSLPASGATTGNYVHTDAASVTATESVNTLKLTTTTTAQSLAITSGKTLTLNAGGLLFVGANDYSISGGTLLGSGGTQKDLVIHQHGSGILTIDSLIANNSTATNLTKTGSGALTLTNANTFTGATSVGGGTLTLKNALALQSSTLTTNGGSVIFDSSVTGNAFTLGALASSFYGPGYDIALQNNAATAITLTVGGNAANTTYVGVISGSGNLNKVGGGTLTLSGGNTYTGTATVSAGTLACGLASLDAFLGSRPGGPDVTVESAGTLGLNQNTIIGTLRLNGGTVTHGNGFAANWGGSVILNATSTFNITGPLTLSAAVSGTGGLTKTGSSKVTLTTGNTYTGNTTISAGTLALDTNGFINNTPQITIAAGGTFDVSATTAYTLSPNTTLVATGTGTTVNTTQATLKGLTTVSLGAQPINMTFSPTTFTGDTLRPSLVVSQGALTLNNNAFTVNNAAVSPLGAGTYRLIQVTGATVNQTGSPSYPVTVTGTGIAADTFAAISVSSGNVNLVVTAATPTQLGFTVQPVNTTAGVTLANVVVQIQDASGNAVAHSGTPITLALNGGTLFSGTTTVNTDASGKATFNSLVIQAAASGLSFTASGTYTSATSGNFNITPAAASKLAFSTQPAGTSVNTTLSAVAVQLQDAFGNAMTQSGTAISLVLNGGSGLGGTIPQNTDGTGKATFSDLAISAANVNLTLTASSGSLTPATSNTFNIVSNPFAPTKLAIVSVNGGSSPTAGAAFSIVVESQDVGGTARNVSANTDFTLSITTGTGTLTGITTGTIASGSNSATVSGVIDTKAEGGVIITAQRTAGDVLGDGSSSAFSVNPDVASSLTVSGYPSPQGAGVAGSVTVEAKDAYGNRATGYSGTIQFSSTDGTATLPANYSFVGGDAGIRSFTNGVTFATAGTQSVTATDTVTGSITATQFNITVYIIPTTFTWANAVSGNWSVAGNWTNPSGQVLAPVTAGQSNYTLNFITGTYTATHNLNNGFLANKLNFAGATTLAGSNTVVLSTDVSTLPTFNQNSSNGVVINPPLSLAGNTTFGGSGSGQVDVNGLISGSGSITKNGSGTLRLYNVNNSFTGGTVINSGTLFMDVNAKLGTGPITLNGGTLYMWRFRPTNALTVNGGTILSENGFNENLLAGPVTLNTTLNCDVYYQLTCSNTISGVGGLTKTSGGPMVLSGTNSYSGQTTINAGTLELSNGAAIADAGAVSLANIAGSTLKLNSSETIGTLAGGGATGGTVNLQANTLTVSVGGTTFAGVIQGTNGALTKNGTGFLVLSGANTYSGATTINGGTITANSLVPSTSYIVNSGGQLYGGWAIPGATFVNSLTLSGTGYLEGGINNGAVRASNNQIFSGPITLAAAARIGMIEGGTTASTFSGQIRGNFALDFQGAFTGSSATQTINLANTGTASTYSGDTSISAVDYSGPYTSGKAILSLGADNQIPNGAGKGNLVFNGANADHQTIFELNGKSETVNGLSNATAAGAIIRNTVTGASVLTIGDADTTSSFSGVMSDAGSGKTLAITKTGTGTLTLTGANTYTGATTVSVGTLALVGGSQASPISVAVGASLQFDLTSGTASTSTYNLTNGTIKIIGTPTLPSYTLTTSTGINGTPVLDAPITGYALTVDGTTLKLVQAGYSSWAAAKGLDDSDAAHSSAKSADPDNDGHNNLYEFAFDGNPLSGVNDGKIVGKIATVSANQVLTLTLPVRTGATFSASSGDQLSALIDGIYYRIEGDVSLSTFADGITEVTTGDEATIQTGLPALSTGWSYRTFRAPGTVPVDPKAFLRAKVSETP